LGGFSKEVLPASSKEESNQAGQTGEPGAADLQEDIIGEVTVTRKDGLACAELDINAMTISMQMKAFGGRDGAGSGGRGRPPGQTSVRGKYEKRDRDDQCGGEGEVSDNTLAMLKKAAKVHERSGVALDISVCSMLEHWGFTTEEYRVPSQEEIGRLLPLVNHDRMEIEEKEEGALVRLKEGQSIDLGPSPRALTLTEWPGLLSHTDWNRALLIWAAMSTAWTVSRD
jgi:hypothetical protein